jgi:hypothetical protein
MTDEELKLRVDDLFNAPRQSLGYKKRRGRPPLYSHPPKQFGIHLPAPLFDALKEALGMEEDKDVVDAARKAAYHAIKNLANRAE